MVLHNKRSGRRPVYHDEIVALIAAVGLQASVQTVDPEELAVAAQKAVRDGAAVIVAAGGDGTVAMVASALVGSAASLGVLPVGTLNHLARDLGIPANPAAAAGVLAAGNVREIDVGELNGRTFVNNCSIGLYPRIVRRREGQRQRLGRGKWFAMALAAVSVFRRYPLVHVVVKSGARTIRCKSPLVFVGNNPYETNLLDLGRRYQLDVGRLCVYLANAPGRWRFLIMMFRGLLGRLGQHRDFTMMQASDLAIETHKKRVRVAMDGEVVRLHPPLVFTTRPRSLRVLAP